MVTPNTLQATWYKVEYRLDIRCATKEAHTKIYRESYILRKKKTLIVSLCNGVTYLLMELSAS
jgi:hypothetical protein